MQGKSVIFAGETLFVREKDRFAEKSLTNDEYLFVRLVSHVYREQRCMVEKKNNIYLHISKNYSTFAGRFHMELVQINNY